MAMNSTIKQRQKKIFITSAFFIATGLFIFSMANFQSGLKSLGEGVYTCFTRVSQSYTAKLLKQNQSSYLSEDFHNITGECYAELLNFTLTQRIFLASNLKAKLNQLSESSYWLTENLKGNNSNLVAGDNQDFNSKFSQLEQTKNESLDLLDVQYGSTHSYFNYAFFFCLIAVAYLISLLVKNAREFSLHTYDGSQAGNSQEDITQETTNQLQTSELEHNSSEASYFSSSKNSAQVTTIEEDLSAALALEFSKHNKQVQQEAPLAARENRDQHINKNLENETENDHRSIAALNDKSSGYYLLYDIIDNALKQFDNDKLSTFFDFDMSKLDQNLLFGNGDVSDSNLGSSKEPLEQILYSIFNFIIESSPKDTNHVIQIDSTGQDQHNYNLRISFKNNDAFNNFDNVNLMIISELAKACRIQFSMALINGTYKFNLHFVEQEKDLPTKRVRQITKGKKREIQNQL